MSIKGFLLAACASLILTFGSNMALQYLADHIVGRPTLDRVWAEHIQWVHQGVGGYGFLTSADTAALIRKRQGDSSDPSAKAVVADYIVRMTSLMDATSQTPGAGRWALLAGILGISGFVLLLRTTWIAALRRGHDAGAEGAQSVLDALDKGPRLK